MEKIDLTNLTEKVEEIYSQCWKEDVEPMVAFIRQVDKLLALLWDIEQQARIDQEGQHNDQQ